MAAVRTLAEANAAGVRIAGVANTATFRASTRASPSATHITVASVDEAVEAMRAGKADAIALSRESLLGSPSSPRSWKSRRPRAPCAAPSMPSA